MNNKSKGEQIFLLLIISTAVLSVLCLCSCSMSCFGCTVGCDSADDGCALGVGAVDEGCGSSSSCKSIAGCIDFEPIYSGAPINGPILACHTQEDDWFTNTESYVGTFCADCGNCGMFFGSAEYYDVEESTYGCTDGCVSCEDTNALWYTVVEDICNMTGLN